MSSSLFITLIALGIIGGLAFFVSAGFRGSGKAVDLAPNLSKYRNDDDLETKTLDRTLTVAVLLASLLTIMIPLYYLGEQNRQDEFAVEFDEVSVERGEHLYEEFGCGNCHGADGSGGAASYVEKRSGISVTWEAPAINNVFFRYDDSEVRYWLIYGRANSPMPAWGLEGGGPMNDGQLDDLIEYLHHFQIPQNEELATIDANVNSSLLRLDSSELLVENEISRQKELIQSVKDAPIKWPVIQKAVEDVSALLSKEGGIDTDEDGLSDSVEVDLSVYSTNINEILGTSILNLDPDNEESIPGRKDKSVANGFLSQLESELINITIVSEGYEKFLNEAETGLAFLEKALEEKLWEVSFEDIADSTFDGDVEKAKRAVGLFNAYCARCHTAGYSAGVAYTKEIASGGLGPALRAGRVNIQFKQREDFIDFIIKGSVNGKAYGVNGVGGGKMPGFGAVLPQSDIELVIDYLREEWNLMREIMRSLLSSNLLVTGIIMFIGSLIVFFGSTFLLNATNLGKRLGFLITGAAMFGWGVINSIFFILYAPRGPAPASIDGLNAFEIRILPITFLIGSSILFIMFLLALNRFEQEQLEKDSQDS